MANPHNPEALAINAKQCEAHQDWGEAARFFLVKLYFQLSNLVFWCNFSQLRDRRALAITASTQVWNKDIRPTSTCSEPIGRPSIPSPTSIDTDAAVRHNPTPRLLLRPPRPRPPHPPHPAAAAAAASAIAAVPDPAPAPDAAAATASSFRFVERKGTAKPEDILAFRPRAQKQVVLLTPSGQTAITQPRPQPAPAASSSQCWRRAARGRRGPGRRFKAVRRVWP